MNRLHCARRPANDEVSQMNYHLGICELKPLESTVPERMLQVISGFNNDNTSLYIS